MTTIEKSASVLIKRPLTEIFNFVADPEKFKHWQPFVKEAAITSPEPIGPSTTYRYTFEAMGHTVETTGKITAYEPFARYEYESTSGPFPIKGGFTFREAGGFVEVTAFGQAEPAGHFTLAGFMLDMLLSRQLRLTLQNLKKILEK